MDKKNTVTIYKSKLDTLSYGLMIRASHRHPPVSASNFPSRYPRTFRSLYEWPVCSAHYDFDLNILLNRRRVYRACLLRYDDLGLHPVAQ